MRSLIAAGLLAITCTTNAQYGTFDPKSVSAAKATSTIVFLDVADGPFNAALKDAVKAHWKFTSDVSFRPLSDLAAMPVDPTKTYLLKTKHNNGEKHDALYLSLVQGWKPKKGETLTADDVAVTNMPIAQELAYIMIDQASVAGDGASMLHVYVKNLQDYLRQVEGGKIKDKATADRLYASRTRGVKEMDLWVAKELLDKSLPDLATVKQTYTRNAQVMGLVQLMAAATKGEAGVALADVVMTGEHKTKWCYRRVFNAKTGELLYQRDEASLHDKKQGFIAEDLRVLEQSR